ncbi:unnamed protein product [Camellia sinensis]
MSSVHEDYVVGAQLTHSHVWGTGEPCDYSRCVQQEILTCVGSLLARSRTYASTHLGTLSGPVVGNTADNIKVCSCVARGVLAILDASMGQAPCS